MTRMTDAQQHEQDVYAKIDAPGRVVEPFGQGLLSPKVRDYLKETESLLRWLPDLVVMIPAARQLVLVDAKGCLSTNTNSPNHSIEMRSLLGAQLTGLPVWYVCQDFRALSMISVIEDGPDRTCCRDCWQTFRSNPGALPKYCPVYAPRRGWGRSGTPFVLVRKDRCVPLERALPSFSSAA
jgi:hypothetical protein